MLSQFVFAMRREKKTIRVRRISLATELSCQMPATRREHARSHYRKFNPKCVDFPTNAACCATTSSFGLIHVSLSNGAGQINWLAWEGVFDLAWTAEVWSKTRIVRKLRYGVWYGTWCSGGVSLGGLVVL